MKRILVVIVIFGIVLSSSALAALGNTEDEVADLFGKPTEQGFPDTKGITTNMYQTGKYIILVQFLRHLSLAESYTRVDRQEFSNDEISALLDGNSNGRGWEKNPDKLEWERDDHKAKAWCEPVRGRPTLLIQAH